MCTYINFADDSSLSSQGNIIGFAVVLSFLILSILVVMLICSCYGLCKFPCKRTVASDRHAQARRNPMIPLPHPGPGQRGAVKPSTSSTFQHGQKNSAITQQPTSTRMQQFGRKNLPPQSFMEGDRHRDSLSPTRTATSNVIHLSQLPSLSCHSDLEQFTQGVANPPSIGRQGGRTHSNQSRHEHHQSFNRQMVNVPSTNSDSAVNVQPRPVDVPVLYPGMVYPYTPCKSPQPPLGVVNHSDFSYSQHHSRQTTALSSRHHQNQIGWSGRSGGESELTDIELDTMTEGETNSVISGRVRHTDCDTTSKSPAYSTVV